MKTNQKRKTAYKESLFYTVAQNVKDIITNPEVARLNKKFRNVPYLSLSKSYLNTGRSEKENYYMEFFEILAKDTPESNQLRKSLLRLCILDDYNAIEYLMDMWGEEMLTFKNKRRSRFWTTTRMTLVMMILNTMTFYLFDHLTWQSALISNASIIAGAISTHICFEPEDVSSTFLGSVAEAMGDGDEKEFENEAEYMVHLENTIFDTLQWATLFSQIRAIPPTALHRNGGAANTSLHKFVDSFMNGVDQAEAEILSIFPFLLAHHGEPVKPLGETGKNSGFDLDSRLCEYLHNLANYPDPDGHIQTFMETFDERMNQKELDKRMDAIKNAMEMQAASKKETEDTDEEHDVEEFTEEEEVTGDELTKSGNVSKN